MSFMKSNGLMAATVLLILGSAEFGFAQQRQESVGVVRIRDGRVRSNVQTASAQMVEQAGGHRSGMVGAPCPSGNCPTGNCPTNGACPSDQCPRCRGCFHGKFGEHYCKHSPDYGYSPPAKYPLQRRGVEYTNYYPQQWYGAGADYSQSTAPMVYQPTDTTQLGYSYQHVPFWQPMPNRLPARPIPAQWHITAPAVSASRYCNGYWPGYMGPYAGHTGWHRGNRMGSYGTDYGMTNSCPPNTQPSTGGGAVVPPIRPVPAPGVIAPQPIIDDGIDSESEESASSNPGKEPGTLPPMPSSAPTGNGIPALNRTPMPTNSAASSHINRS